MAWATADDVIEAWIGPGAPTDLGQVELWIGRAERLIRNAVPGIQDRIDDLEADLLENVVDVVASMVERRFRNPDGTRQVSSTTGPFSEQRTYGGDQPGALFITADELALLAGVSAGSGAFSINLIPTTSYFHPDYEPVYPWV